LSDRLILPVLLLATVCLALGVFLPVVEVSNLAIFASRFSTAEAAWELMADEQYPLGIVIIVFSVVFPLGKKLAAAALSKPFQNTGETPATWIGRLVFFVRRSCADVLQVDVAIPFAKHYGTPNEPM